MEARFEGDQGPEGAVVPWVDVWIDRIRPVLIPRPVF
jgi:hypothetical protein